MNTNFLFSLKALCKLFVFSGFTCLCTCSQDTHHKDTFQAPTNMLPFFFLFYTQTHFQTHLQNVCCLKQKFQTNSLLQRSYHCNNLKLIFLQSIAMTNTKLQRIYYYNNLISIISWYISFFF